MSDLTEQQSKIYEAIKVSISRHGMPPTRAELARLFKFKSANAAEEHLRAIAKKGYIELIPKISRGIRVIQPGSPAQRSGDAK